MSPWVSVTPATQAGLMKLMKCSPIWCLLELSSFCR